MEHLFSPWRHKYVTRNEDGEGCVFCECDADGPNKELLLFEGQRCFIILNLYPYNSGHLMVVPRRHVPNLAGLEPEELAELGELTRRSEMVLTEAYAPQGINIGINLGRPAGAGVVNHLHVHLVPRWNGDTNFMSVVGGTRVLPEDLPRTVERLRPIFQRLSTS